MAKHTAIARRQLSPIAWVGVFLAASLAYLMAFAVPSHAGKPTGGGTSGSSLSVVNVDPNDATINYNDTVTFNVSTTATTQPMVELDCFQNGTKVYWASAGFYASYPWPAARNYLLSSPQWTGGAANCTATLYYTNSRGRVSNITSISFNVAA